MDMHGPYDHQSLLDPAKQLEILDAFGGIQEEQNRYRSLSHVSGYDGSNRTVAGGRRRSMRVRLNF